MATSITNELTHDEALELLPWHVNASLNEHLSRQVAKHIDECEACQRESAILSSTMIAFNTEEPDYRDVDNRFQRLLTLKLRRKRQRRITPIGYRQR